MKTTTVAALLLTGSSFFKGKEDTEVFNRRIPETNIRTAWVVVMLGLGVVLTSTVALAIVTEGMAEGAYLINILYEVTSAGGHGGADKRAYSHTACGGQADHYFDYVYWAYRSHDSGDSTYHPRREKTFGYASAGPENIYRLGE